MKTYFRKSLAVVGAAICILAGTLSSTKAMKPSMPSGAQSYQPSTPFACFDLTPAHKPFFNISTPTSQTSLYKYQLLEGYYYDLKQEKLVQGSHFKSNKELLPNIIYRTGEKDYRYKTDSDGRICEFEAENLQTKNLQGIEKRKNLPSFDLADQRESDDKGHLIADEFGGSNKIDNLVPMDFEINQLADGRGHYRKLETYLKTNIQNGASVSIKGKLIYNESRLRRRPGEFQISYSIDGERSWNEEKIPNFPSKLGKVKTPLKMMPSQPKKSQVEKAKEKQAKIALAAILEKLTKGTSYREYANKKGISERMLKKYRNEINLEENKEQIDAIIKRCKENNISQEKIKKELGHLNLKSYFQ